MRHGPGRRSGEGRRSRAARGETRSNGDDAWEPEGRFGAVTGLDGRMGTQNMPGVFAQVGMEYSHRYGGADFKLVARISERNHSHSTLNPLAAYQKAMSADDIMNDMMIAYPNTRPMCSANCDGGAAAVVVSDAKLRTLPNVQQRRAVKVSASVLTSDPYVDGCQVLPDVNTLTRAAATQAYEQAGDGPEDLDLVELHDCFATAELVHYDNLMLCPEGGGRLLRDRDPVARRRQAGQCLRGSAVEGAPDRRDRDRQHLGGLSPPAGGSRRPPNRGAQVSLAHVIGLGSACGVHILEKAAA